MLAFAILRTLCSAEPFAILIFAFANQIDNIHLWRTVFIKNSIPLACSILACAAFYNACVTYQVSSPPVAVPIITQMYSNDNICSQKQTHFSIHSILLRRCIAVLDAVLVGKVIQKFREEKGLSQEVLSGFADIGRTHLSAIERGTRKPTLETFYRVCEAMDVRPSVLLRAIEDEVDKSK